MILLLQRNLCESLLCFPHSSPSFQYLLGQAKWIKEQETKARLHITQEQAYNLGLSPCIIISTCFLCHRGGVNSLSLHSIAKVLYSTFKP